MDRQGKERVKSEIAASLTKASAVILAEYRGLSVEQVTTLRCELREIEAEFRVTKNRVTKLAISENEQFSSLKDSLTGPVGIIFAFGDAAAAAKTAVEFSKANEKFIVTSGAMEGKQLSEDDLKALSSLPSKEVLLGQICAAIASPARGLVMTLSGVTRNLVQVMAAVRDTKQ